MWRRDMDKKFGLWKCPPKYLSPNINIIILILTVTIIIIAACIRNLVMMIYLICQLDWAPRCPDIWSNTVLSVLMRVLLCEINIWINRLSKGDCPPQCGWRPHSIHWLPEEKKQAEEGRTCFVCLPLSWSIVLLLPTDLDLDWNICHQLFYFSGLQT